MTAAVLLSVALAGQCGPSGCPAPGLAPLTLSPAPVPAQPAPRPQVEGRDYYVVKRYRVEHEGVSFVVEGYFRPDTGMVVWDRERPFNRLSHAAAVARPAADTPKEAPKADTRPVGDTERRPAADPRPPAEPGQEVGQVRAIQNFGLSPERMTHPRNTYHAPSPEARRFVEEAKAPADPGQKYHVTVIGADDARAPVVNDLAHHPAFEAIRGNLLVQDYRPGEWAVDPSLGFPGSGSPAIVVQTARGKADLKGGRVVFRATSYEAGPTGLAEAIRKADPSYRPDLDPGPPGPSPAAGGCPLGFTRDHWPAVALTAVALLYLKSLPRKAG